MFKGNYLRAAIVICSTFLAVACSRTVRQDPKHLDARSGATSTSNSLSRQAVWATTNLVPLAWVVYSDPVSLGIIKELFARNGIQYDVFSNLGISVLVRGVDFDRAKAILESNMRLKGEIQFIVQQPR